MRIPRKLCDIDVCILNGVEILVIYIPVLLLLNNPLYVRSRLPLNNGFLLLDSRDMGLRVESCDWACTTYLELLLICYFQI